MYERTMEARWTARCYARPLLRRENARALRTMTAMSPQAPLSPLEPTETVHLMPGLHAELIALLRRLAPEDWARPTLARGWRVRDVAAHLLDTQCRHLSAKRDEHRLPPDRPIASYGDLVGFINHLNAQWVEATARLSPRLITEMLALVGPEVAAQLATLDPWASSTFPVAWAGETVSANWFDIGREYTEWWHHQAQIRDAVGAPPLNGRAWLHPFLELSLRGLPHAYRGAEAPPGTTIAITIDGEAGDTWALRRRDNATGAGAGDDAGRAAARDASAAGWELLRGEAPDAVTRLRLDADAAWRLLFNALDADEARRAVRVEGEARLAEPLLAARSVMV